MITLSEPSEIGPELHIVPSDPGGTWMRDAQWVIDAAPDDEVEPCPKAGWPAEAARTGICGVVSPRVVGLANGGYRMYYTQLLPRPGFPLGAVDYDNSTSRILSAFSADGSLWTPEPGVRLSARDGGAGEYRVVSSEVVPTPNASGDMRMYYECCRGTQSVGNTILSARSEDGGICWALEPGVRWGNGTDNFAAPRIQFLNEGGLRLYCFLRGRGIVSAVSEDGGLTFQEEPGLRIAQNGPYDSHAAFAPEIMQIRYGHYVMYYAGYRAPNRSYILRATSEDGLNWLKDEAPIISPEKGAWDGVKCSEMSVVKLPVPQGSTPQYRMFYEGCDGTSVSERGVWRVVSATSATQG